MKQQVLTYYTKLLAHIHQPLLPHINVHRPVQVSRQVFIFATLKKGALILAFLSNFLDQKLIRLCGEVLAGPTENEEIQFLCIVCAKLKQDPYLVDFFLEVSFFDSRGGKHWRHIRYYKCSMFPAYTITISCSWCFCRTRQRSLSQRILEGHRCWRTTLWLWTLVSH